MDSGNNFTPFDIGSFFVDGEEYTNEESSIADCVSTNKSWYYDRDETVLYMHIDGGEDPRLHHIIVGVTIGLSNKSKHVNDGYYRPCIAGGFSIEKSVDPLEFGVVRFSGTKNIQLHNEDGYFDNFMDNILYGQPARAKYGIDDMDGTEMSYADYRQVMKLYIEKFTLNWTRCQMVLVDYRKLFSRKLPIRFFNKDDYPNLKDSNVGKPIPLTWGPAYNVEAVCTNDEESGSPANYTFKLVDVTDHANGIKSIDKVTVENTDKTAYKTDDLTNGQFTLPSAHYSPGQRVYVDYQGFVDGGSNLIKNSLDVIEDILDTYLEVPYNANNYNTTAWEAIQASTKNLGVHIGKQEKVSTIIGKIALSNFGYFIQQDDGLFTFKILDRTAAADETVLLNEYFDEPEIDFDGSRYLSSVRIGYAKDQANDEYRWYEDNSLESDIVAEYKKYNSKDYETYLTSKSDAQDLAGKFMDFMKEVRGTLVTATGIQRVDFEIGDVKNLTLDRRDRGWKGALKTAIIGLKQDLTGTGKVTITGLILVD
jgi:hypothetical protein